MTAPPPSAPPLALRPSPPSLDDLLRELDLGALSTKQQAAARIKRDFLTPPRHLSEPAWLDSFALCVSPLSSLRPPVQPSSLPPI